MYRSHDLGIQKNGYRGYVYEATENAVAILHGVIL